MAGIFRSYRTLSSQQQLDFYDAFFVNRKSIITNDGKEIDFISDENSCSYILPNDEWKKSKSLTIHIQVEIDGNKIYSILFGKKDYLICTNDSELGLALSWQLSDSLLSGSCPGISKDQIKYEIKYKDKLIYDFYLEFSTNDLSGIFKSDFFLYLKKTGLFEPGFCSIVGTRLGYVFSDLCLVFSDNKPLFPIINVSGSKEDPLWSTYVQDEINPLTDSFTEDYVYIAINTNHPDFKKLKYNNRYTPLMFEIMSSALESIILKLCSQDNFIETISSDLKGFPSSIVETVRFMQKHYLEIGSQDRIHYSVRKMISSYVRRDKNEVEENN